MAGGFPLSPDPFPGAGAGAGCAMAAGGGGGGSGRRGGRSSKRSAGLGGSAPRLAKWLGDIRGYFNKDVVAVIQKDAIDCGRDSFMHVSL